MASLTFIDFFDLCNMTLFAAILLNCHTSNTAQKKCEIVKL